MFIKTIQFNRKTAIAAVLAAALLIILLVLIFARGGDKEGKKLFDFSGGGTTEARVSYLLDCGWEVDPEPLESKEVLIPREFSEVLTEYNRLQQQCGFDLSEYAGLTVEQYSYAVTNYPGYDGSVEATLYVYERRIIGGDIHATALDGFMHGLK